MKAISVSRVSTEEQKDAGNSLPAQAERINQYCGKRVNFEVIESFSFEESAYKEKRDEFDKLLEFVQKIAKKEKIAVCFDKVDRLSRSVFDKRVGTLYEMAIADTIELHFVSDGQVINNQMSAVEKFQFGMSLGLAKYYSDAIGDNVKRAFEQKRKNGELTGPAPIGYMSVPLDISNRTRTNVVQDPETSHIVQRLFDLYSTGNYSITSLWEEAKKYGLKGKNGKFVARSVIEHILKSEFYYGFAYSRKYNQRYPHKYECLITRETFEKCKDIRERRKQKPSKEVSKPYIFKGLLSCSNCGCLMSPEIKKGKYIYYSCTNAKGICHREYINEETLLKPIYEVLDAFESIPEEVQAKLVEELRNTSEMETLYHKKQIKRLRGASEVIQTKKERLLDRHLDGSITSDDYTKKLNQLHSEQQKLNIELEEYMKGDYEYHLHVGTVLSISRRAKEIFESSEIDEKRAILRYLLQNPTVKGKKLSFTLASPFNLVLEVASEPTLKTMLRGQDSNLRPIDYI
jgi:site-specific DNA recombinase